MIKYSSIFIIALFVFIKGNFLYSQDKIDTSEVKKVELYEPIRKHGSLFLLNNEAHQYINKTEIQENDYLDFADILIQETSFYPLHLSSLGLSNIVSFGAGNYNQFSFNGVNLSNPISLNSNLSQYSPEYTENIEIYTGMMSSIFSDNSTSTLINSPEIIYNTNKPFFRFWGADAGENYLALDGIFAQNLAPNISFNLGIRSVTGKGVYENDEVRSRSLRSGLRWNLSENQNLSIAWMHNNHFLNEYGGISVNSISENGKFVDDPISAISRFNKNSQRKVQNDFIANYSFIADNKMSAVSSQFYLLDNFNYDFKNNTLFQETTFKDRMTYYTRKVGANFSYEAKLSDLFFKTKFELNNSFIENNYYTHFDGNYNKVNYSALLFSSYKIDNLLISGGYRYSNLYSKNLNNYGIKFTFNLSKYNFIVLDYSNSKVVPILPFNNINVENNEMYYLRYISKSNLFNFDLDFYFRNIKNLISYSINSENKLIATNFNNPNSYYGANLNLQFRWLKGSGLFDYEIFTNFKTNLNFSTENSQIRLPLLHSFIDSYITIPKGRSRADIGVRFSYLTENSGLTQFPDLNIYIDNNFTNQNGLARNEAYIKLRLGQAYLKVSLINFINKSYYYVPMYNSLPSNFRITFNWTLI